MKILHFVHNFPPEFRGGTESYVLNLSMRQARTGHLVHVVSGSAREDAGKDLEKELMGAVRVTRLFQRPEERSGERPHHTPRISRAALEIMRYFDPDIVHVHHWHHLSDDLVRLASRDRFPTVLTLHDFFSVCPRFFRVKPGRCSICGSGTSPGECFACIREEHAPWPADLMRSLYARRRSFYDEVRSADILYTFSRTVADYFKAVPWFPHQPIGVFPIGILRPLQRCTPRENATPLKIATWGGQTEVKGTHLLLEAASTPALKERVEVHILGKTVDPGYRERIERLKQGCRAVLHGFFPEAEKETLGARFDLAVFPTQAFETYSIVVDEALSMGMPVITTRPGAQSERVGEAGRIVPAGDVEALAGAIQAFLDPEARWRAARAAERIRIGTMDNHWMELREVYKRLASRNPRRGGRGFRSGTPSWSYGAARPGFRD